jgi:aspartyl-tRNA(Asn)/glutamyl-tRNA(Gln) amidotransferase subunit C
VAMAQLKKEDILKLADLSAVKLSDAEVDLLLHDLQNLISYVDELNTVQLSAYQHTGKNTNVFRDDEVITQNSAPLLAQAPESFDTYFVVPKVVDSTKDAS